MRRKSKWLPMLICTLVFLGSFSVLTGKTSNVYAAENDTSSRITYQTHVQTYGWQKWKSEGEMSGTEGQAKRLEGIKIQLQNQEYAGSVEYQTHVQTYGWQDWKKDGAMSGTEGQAKRLEAIRIRLTGDMAEAYDIYYRVHAQTFGWMGWAKNGEPAGTAAYAKRLEGIEIRLVEKGGEAPGNTSNAFKQQNFVQYRTHVQTYGWQGWKKDGAIAGTTGLAKRLEAINVSLVSQAYSGDIEYQTHVQTYGWQNWVKNGAMSGTSGQAKRLEAIRIRLTGEMAEQYDIYYRVHAQTYGWLGWAKNGDPAGTAGYAKRLEAIQIKLVAKNGPAPGNTDNPYHDSSEEAVHQHTWKEHQVWVPNIVTVVDEPEKVVDGAQLYTKQENGTWISNGEIYWFENGFTKDDLKEIISEKIKNEGYIGNYVNKQKVVPAVTHEEDHGSYQTNYYYCDCGAKKDK